MSIGKFDDKVYVKYLASLIYKLYKYTHAQACHIHTVHTQKQTTFDLDRETPRGDTHTSAER